MEYVRNGEIVLNISPDATRNLKIGNELIQFSARFNGVSREVSVPMATVAGIFAKENGQGLAFQSVGGERAGLTPVPHERGRLRRWRQAASFRRAASPGCRSSNSPLRSSQPCPEGRVAIIRSFHGPD